MKKALIVTLLLIFAGSLTGCQQEADTSIKDSINFFPNEEYEGEAYPIVEEDMKLTDEERRDFEKIQAEILSKKEGEENGSN